MDREITDPYGFIYITTNLINGKRYIGQKIFDERGRWKYYKGSGKILKEAFKKYGRDNFSTNIIDIAYSFEELNEKEISYISFFDAQNSDDYYNLEKGGVNTKEFPKRDQHPNHYRIWTEESRRKVSEWSKGRISPNKGKKASEETRQKLRDAWVKRKKRGDIGTKKPIKVLETGQVFSSIKEASEELGLVYGSIVNVLAGRRNSVYGYTFIHISKEEYNKYENEICEAS